MRKIIKIFKKKLEKDNQRKKLFISSKKSLQKSVTLTSSKILSEKYSSKDTQIILLEITNNLTKKLLLNKRKTNCIRLYVGYQNDELPGLKLTLNLREATDSSSQIIKTIIKSYQENVNKDGLVKKIGISFSVQ